MFGDAGHAAIMLLFALLLVCKESKLQREAEKSEVSTDSLYNNNNNNKNKASIYNVLKLIGACNDHIETIMEKR